MTKEVSKLSSQNQLIVTKLTSLIQKIGSAADENRSLRSLLFTLSKSTQTKVRLVDRNPSVKCCYELSTGQHASSF